MSVGRERVGYFSVVVKFFIFVFREGVGYYFFVVD